MPVGCRLPTAHLEQNFDASRRWASHTGPDTSPVFVGKPRLPGDSPNPAAHQWPLQRLMWLLAGRRGWPTLTPLSWKLGTTSLECEVTVTFQGGQHLWAAGGCPTPPGVPAPASPSAAHPPRSTCPKNTHLTFAQNLFSNAEAGWGPVCKERSLIFFKKTTGA